MNAKEKMPESVIYLDNHATTQVDPRVVDAMIPWFTKAYGNASSIGHSFGEEAREAVDAARETIAKSIGAEATEIVFTSGATESNNLAIRGIAEQPRQKGTHLISAVTEHNAVLAPLERLTKKGFDVTLLGVEPHGSPLAGRVDPSHIADAIREETCLVSVMLANNEMGVVQPIKEIAALCHERSVLLHCDATQAIGKLPLDAKALGVDLMSFTAHKFHGPKGVGALYVRKGSPIIRLDAQIIGGGQERGRRGGTLNVPGIVGFAQAVGLACEEQTTESERLASLRNQLFALLRQQLDGIELCGPELDATDAEGHLLRLPNNLNFHVEGVDGESIMLETPELAISSGAACSSSDPEPSHVLQALGLSADQARCSLRIGFGRFSTESDVTLAAEALVRAIKKLRQLA